VDAASAAAFDPDDENVLALRCSQCNEAYGPIVRSNRSYVQTKRRIMDSCVCSVQKAVKSANNRAN